MNAVQKETLFSIQYCTYLRYKLYVYLSKLKQSTPFAHLYRTCVPNAIYQFGVATDRECGTNSVVIFNHNFILVYHNGDW